MGENEKQLLCPYCGHVQAAAARCAQCGGLFESLSRSATQTTMGPWFVRDPRQPFLPGCSYEVLVRQAQVGRLTADSIVRGPTTRQFWTLARHAPGVAHLVGLCDRCGASVDPLGTACGSCGSVFVRPAQRNELGLQYPTAQAAAEAQRQIREQRRRVGEMQAAATSGGGGNEDASPIELGEPLEDPRADGRHKATTPAAISAMAAAAQVGDAPRSGSHRVRPQRPGDVMVDVPDLSAAGAALAAMADPGDRPAQGAYSIGQLVSALSVEAAEDQPGTTVAQLRGGMRVRMPGKPLGQGMWLAFAAAAAILGVGLVLLVVTHG